MRTIKNSPIISETLRVIANGKRKRIKITTHIDDIIKNYGNHDAKLIEAQRAMMENATPENVAEFKKAAAEAMTLIFGEKAFKEIEELYEYRHMEIIRDFTPFIKDRLVKAVSEKNRLWESEKVGAFK